MSNLTNQDFNHVFLNVRNAYRLLYLYQRRVMDVMKFIGDQLSLRYSGGWSWFSSSSPKDGKGSLDNWAWDWLNMYMYEFHFSNTVIDNNTIQFSVVLISDTGFFDTNGQDERNLNSFASTDTSSTKLLFLAGKNAWHGDFKDFDQNYTKSATEYIRQSEKGHMLAKSFDLTQFLNSERSIIAINDFAQFCRSNGIPELAQLKS